MFKLEEKYIPSTDRVVEDCRVCAAENELPSICGTCNDMSNDYVQIHKSVFGSVLMCVAQYLSVLSLRMGPEAALLRAFDGSIKAVEGGFIVPVTVCVEGEWQSSLVSLDSKWYTEFLEEFAEYFEIKDGSLFLKYDMSSFDLSVHCCDKHGLDSDYWQMTRTFMVSGVNCVYCDFRIKEDKRNSKIVGTAIRRMSEGV